jgi:hypothetical protein
MRTKWFSGTGLAGLLALGMTTGAVVAAHAEETEYKLTACGHLLSFSNLALISRCNQNKFGISLRRPLLNARRTDALILLNR